MKSTGRLPKWCSPACRHRAWEQARAAASGRAAVQVVDRPVVVTPADVAGWTGQVEQLATELHGSAWPASGGELDALRVALGLAMSALEDRARFPGYDRWPGQLLSD